MQNNLSNRPSMQGLRHVALFSQDLKKVLYFYQDLLGMKIVWQPDEENIYLSSGSDNLALHAAKGPFPEGQARLDHIGFFIESEAMVKEWHEYLSHHNVTIHSDVKYHRDGAVSFYCADPDDNTVQFIWMGD